MQINVSTSEETEAILAKLQSRFSVTSKNILMRIALAYSLTRGRKLSLSKPEDTKGNPYKEITIVGNYRSYYIALICQFYDIYKTDSDIPKYFKLHIDDGLRLLEKLFCCQELRVKPSFALKPGNRLINRALSAAAM